MGLKYIYAGFSKCGTKTIAAAFRTLGYNVYDWEETFLYTIDHWLAFYAATTVHEKHKILYDMLKDVDIVMDGDRLRYAQASHIQKLP